MNLNAFVIMADFPLQCKVAADAMPNTNKCDINAVLVLNGKIHTFKPVKIRIFQLYLK